MTTYIYAYIKNVIVGKCIINSLYNAVDKALSLQGYQTYCYRFTMNPYGSKLYTKQELINLYNLSLCTNVQTVASEIDGNPTIEQAALLLMLAKCTFRGLYQAYLKQIYMQSELKIFCYTFTNPYGIYANVDQNKLNLYCDEERIFRFNECPCETFDAQLLWSFT